LIPLALCAATIGCGAGKTDSSITVTPTAIGGHVKLLGALVYGQTSAPVTFAPPLGGTAAIQGAFNQSVTLLNSSWAQQLEIWVTPWGFLKGAAANDKGEVTLANLISYLQDTVPKHVAIDLGGGKQQRPFSEMAGYKADELVIAVTAKVATNPTAVSPTVTTVDPTAFALPSVKARSCSWQVAQDCRPFSESRVS